MEIDLSEHAEHFVEKSLVGHLEGLVPQGLPGAVHTGASAKPPGTAPSGLNRTRSNMFQQKGGGAKLTAGVKAQIFKHRMSKITHKPMSSESFEEVVTIKTLRQLMKFFFTFPPPREETVLSKKLDQQSKGGFEETGAGDGKKQKIRQQKIRQRTSGKKSNTSPLFQGLEDSSDPDDTDELDEEENYPIPLDGAIPKSLSEEEFVDAVASILVHQDRKEITKWYRAIDADGNGVGWDEFSTFLLSHGTQRHGVEQGKSEFPTHCAPMGCPSYYQHSDLISSLVVHPKTGRVFTGSKDGSVRVWDGDSLKHVKLLFAGNSYITDMKLMRNGQRLLICSLDRTLSVFDTKSFEIVRSYNGRPVTDMTFAEDSAPIIEIGQHTESYAAPKNVRANKLRRQVINKPDEAQTLTFEQFQAIREAEKQRRLEKKKLEQSTLSGLVEAPTCIECHTNPQNDDIVFCGTRSGLIRLYVLPSIPKRVLEELRCFHTHSDQVHMMKFAPLLGGLLSCSDDHTIRLTSLETEEVTKEFSRNGHERGVHCIDFNAEAKLIVSCGAERTGLVWDHIALTPVGRLNDHTAPLLKIAFNATDNQIVTLASDMIIKVFDIRNYKCVQTIHEKKSKDFHFGTMIFDDVKQRLLCGSTFPVQYQIRKKAATFPPNYLGHTIPLVGALYNPTQERLLTFDNDTVIVWGSEKGECCFTFLLSSFHNNTAAANDDFKLTSFTFDSRYRRLLTGFHKGIVVIWNYSNGAALHVIKPHDASEAKEVHAVTAVIRNITSVFSKESTTFYVVSVGEKILVAREGEQMTVTHVEKWAVSVELGYVTSLLPVSPQCVACGTLSGAVIFFHILNMMQDGRALWCSDYDEDPAVSTSPSARSIFTEAVSSHSGSPFSQSPKEAPSEQQGNKSPSEQQTFKAVATIEKLIPLPKVGNVFASYHTDGRVVFWDPGKRSFAGCLNLFSRTSTIVQNVAIDEVRNDYLGHSDEFGNVHVWQLQPVYSKDERSGSPSQKSLSLTGEKEKPKKKEDDEMIGGATISLEKQLKENLIVANMKATKLSCFFTNEKQISSVTFVRLVQSPCLATTSVDCSTRFFTVRGVCIGHFGVRQWTLSGSASWMGNRPQSPVMHGIASSTVDSEALLQSISPSRASHIHLSTPLSENEESPKVPLILDKKTVHLPPASCGGLQPPSEVPPLCLLSVVGNSSYLPTAPFVNADVSSLYQRRNEVVTPNVSTRRTPAKLARVPNTDRIQNAIDTGVIKLSKLQMERKGLEFSTNQQFINFDASINSDFSKLSESPSKILPKTSFVMTEEVARRPTLMGSSMEDWEDSDPRKLSIVSESSQPPFQSSVKHRPSGALSITSPLGNPDGYEEVPLDSFGEGTMYSASEFETGEEKVPPNVAKKRLSQLQQRGSIVSGKDDVQGKRVSVVEGQDGKRVSIVAGEGKRASMIESREGKRPSIFSPPQEEKKRTSIIPTPEEIKRIPKPPTMEEKGPSSEAIKKEGTEEAEEDTLPPALRAMLAKQKKAAKKKESQAQRQQSIIVEQSAAMQEAQAALEKKASMKKAKEGDNAEESKEKVPEAPHTARVPTNDERQRLLESYRDKQRDRLMAAHDGFAEESQRLSKRIMASMEPSGMMTSSKAQAHHMGFASNNRPQTVGSAEVKKGAEGWVERVSTLLDVIAPKAAQFEGVRKSAEVASIRGVNARASIFGGMPSKSDKQKGGLDFDISPRARMVPGDSGGGEGEAK